MKIENKTIEDIRANTSNDDNFCCKDAKDCRVCVWENK